MNSSSQPLVVIIDADSTPSEHGKAIFEEFSGLSEVFMPLCYGDSSSGHLTGWSERIASLALVPHHQSTGTVGINSSDFALVIDATDLPHSGRLDGFAELIRATRKFEEAG